MKGARRHSPRLLAGFALLLAVAPLAATVRTADADITVIGRYTFINGDTATRSAPFTNKRGRLTAPDGREFIYDTKSKKVTVIDHQAKTYWSAPIQVADSLAAERLTVMRRELKPEIEANRERFNQLMQTIEDSTKVEMTEEHRTIAGYSCRKWVLTMGPYLTYERWVTPAIGVADYAPELERVMLASVMDPMGRLLLRNIFRLRAPKETIEPGLPRPADFALASSTKFETLTQKGSFSWEATSVKTGKVPGLAWDKPKGYRKVAP